jgi:uncharacterized protein YukE
MTSGFSGMVVQDVRNLAQQLKTHAETIQQLMGQLDGAVNGVTWMGHDADMFKHQWWPQHRQQLQQVVQGLHDFSQSASNNAQAQEDTSRV